MHLIHPIEAKECELFRGQYVCAVMQDNNRHYGILSRADKGKLYLNDFGSHSDKSQRSQHSETSLPAQPSSKDQGEKSRSKKTSGHSKTNVKTKKSGLSSKKAVTRQDAEVPQQQSDSGTVFDFFAPIPSPRPVTSPANTDDTDSPYGKKAVLNLNEIAALYPV